MQQRLSDEELKAKVYKIDGLTLQGIVDHLAEGTYKFTAPVIGTLIQLDEVVEDKVEE